MNPIVRNTLAIVAGFVIGGAVNMGLITLGPQLIPPPQGADLATMDGLKAAMPLFEPRHFITPFVAHALGTLVGALIAAMLAASHKMRFALAIGVIFLAGGITMVVLLPSPLWFNLLDLGVAYLPMAWIGGKLATRKG